MYCEEHDSMSCWMVTLQMHSFIFSWLITWKWLPGFDLRHLLHRLLLRPLRWVVLHGLPLHLALAHHLQEWESATGGVRISFWAQVTIGQGLFTLSGHSIERRKLMRRSVLSVSILVVATNGTAKIILETLLPPICNKSPQRKVISPKQFISLCFFLILVLGTNMGCPLFSCLFLHSFFPMGIWKQVFFTPKRS